MKRLYLVAEISGSRFAIPADTVESVVTASEVIPVPLAAPMVAGVAALRSKVITVIDTIASINGGLAAVSKGQSLIVVHVGDFLYGLAVDAVHDVCECVAEPEKLGAAFEAGWRRISIGAIEADGSTIAVIDPTALVCEPQEEAA